LDLKISSTNANFRLGQLAGGEPDEAVLRQSLEADRAEQLLGRRELGEQPLEVAAAEHLREAADERRLRGARRAEQEHVLAGEHRREGAIDDVLALGELRHQVGAKLIDLLVHDEPPERRRATSFPRSPFKWLT